MHLFPSFTRAPRVFAKRSILIFLTNASFSFVASHVPDLIQIFIDDVTYVHIQTALCWQNTVHVMFRRAKRHVVMVRFCVLSSWLPKHKGFCLAVCARIMLCFRVTLEVTSSIDLTSVVSVPIFEFIVQTYILCCEKYLNFLEGNHLGSEVIWWPRRCNSKLPWELPGMLSALWPEGCCDGSWLCFSD